MKIPKIKKAFIDGDLLIFPAASSKEVQRIEYYFVDPDGNEVGSFDSAKAAKNWLEECQIMECDVQFGYEGDLSKLVRHDRLHIGEFEEAIKVYKRMLKKWVKASGAKEYVVYVSKKSGLENFRHKAALRKPYKGNRKGSAKPYYLEQLRQYVLTLPHHKKAIGNFETDDIVCGLAQRHNTNVLIQNEKDGLQCVGCYIYFPDYHDEPVFSTATTVGYVEKVDKKLYGLGHLFLLGQVLTGDNADNYSGLDGMGAVGAYDLLSPFNNKPIKHLSDAVYAVIRAYYDKYGLTYQYKNKDGEMAVGSWKDFLIESLNLAYMRKGRNDTDTPFIHWIEKFEKEIGSEQ